jgi:uncharacterized OB-fold protein
VTETSADIAALELADPMTAPFWAACREHRLVIQHCSKCGRHQFYPRPLCLTCQSRALEWVEASGCATIYSLTVVRVPVAPDLVPPYFLAVVELAEGPRMLTNILGQRAKIGDPVKLAWRERKGQPDLPVFEVEA